RTDELTGVVRVDDGDGGQHWRSSQRADAEPRDEQGGGDTHGNMVATRPGTAKRRSVHPRAPGERPGGGASEPPAQLRVGGATRGPPRTSWSEPLRNPWRSSVP